MQTHNHDHHDPQVHDLHEHGADAHDHVQSAAHDLDHFRAHKDAFMREHPQSPVPVGDRDIFQGLSYYPYNPDLHLHLTLEPAADSNPITFETSTGDKQEFRRAGTIHFEVDGQPAELTIYASSDGSLFLPMRDATSGKETYGAGRYLEPDLLDDNTVHVDFNLLYNPYCAYNEAYSCPLPPRENWLRVPIRAGEKTYQHAHTVL